MDWIKKFWNRIKNPHGIWLGLFYLFFIAVVTVTLTLVITNPSQTFVHYILYTVSAIALTYFVYSIVVLAPKIKNAVVKLLRKFSFTRAMLDSYGYRTIIFSIFSFILNISYVVLQGVLAIITKSAWYISITAYYLVLSLMKGNVFLSKKKYGNDEEKLLKTYRATGIMFILLTIAFSGIIVLIYTSDMYFEYSGLMIYVISAYTFYKLILSIYNIFKARKQDDMCVQNIRNINLSNALISVVVLQVAMFQAFAPEHNKSVANGLTGGLMSLIILALGCFMIIKANKQLKQETIKQEISNEK